MKLNSKYISLIVLSFILVLVAGISFLSIEKFDVEEVYAASVLNEISYGTSVPDGYVLLGDTPIDAGTPLFIDTSVSVPCNFSPVATTSDVNDVFNVPLTSVSFHYATSDTNVSSTDYCMGLSLVRAGSAYSWKIASFSLLYLTSSGDYSTGSRFWNFNSSSSVSGNSRWVFTYYLSSYSYGYITFNSLSWVSTEYDNNFLYYDSNYVPSVQPVTQSLPITFDSGVSSVSLGNQTWSSSGASNSVVFDDEDNTYTFNVTLNNSVLRSVTYNLSSDTTVGGILNATISGSSFTCECPVGDSIESITIYTDPLIYSSPCVITFDEHIQKIECDGIEWTASGQSNDIYYDLTSGSMSLTFDVTLSNGYIVDDYSIRMTSGLMTSSLNGNQLTVSGISSSGDSIQSISFTSELLTVGVVSYVQTWSPNVSGDYTGQIDYSGSSGILNLPVFTISAIDISFSNYVELYEYIFGLLQNSGSSVVLTNAMQYQIYGVRYFDDTEVSFPLTYDNYYSSKGGLVFLTRRKISTVSFSQPSLFGYFPASETFEDGIFPFNSSYDYVSSLTYYVAPYMFGSNWSLVTNLGNYDLLSGNVTSVRLYIDGVLWGTYDCNAYLGRDYVSPSVAINLNPVSAVLTSLTQENLVFYYLDSVVYYNNAGTNDYTELYFSSGSSNWQPTIYDSFDLLGRIFDGVLDILDIHLTADITLKTILLIVLALGILLFVFRISGVF